MKYASKKEIENLIKENKLIDSLEQMSEVPILKKYQKRILSYISELEEINSNISLGLISQQDSKLEINRIRKGTVDLWNKLPSKKEFKNEPISQDSRNSKRGRIIITFILATIFTLLGLFYLL